jgi:hypothetical protein
MLEIGLLVKLDLQKVGKEVRDVTLGVIYELTNQLILFRCIWYSHRLLYTHTILIISFEFLF